jgi:hypothetical protein
MKDARKKDLGKRGGERNDGMERLVFLWADDDLNNSQEIKVTRHARALPEYK